MNGVEILATEEVAAGLAFSWTAFGIAGSVVLILVVILGIAVIRKSGYFENIVMFVFAGLLIGTIVGGGLGAITATPTEYETQYKVTISDEVSMNEFLEKYEIIDQEGKILTIRERE